MGEPRVSVRALGELEEGAPQLKELEGGLCALGEVENEDGKPKDLEEGVNTLGGLVNGVSAL